MRVVSFSQHQLHAEANERRVNKRAAFFYRGLFPNSYFFRPCRGDNRIYFTMMIFIMGKYGILVVFRSVYFVDHTTDTLKRENPKYINKPINIFQIYSNECLNIIKLLKIGVNDFFLCLVERTQIFQKEN